MGRGKNPANFVSLETKKLNQSCTHYKEGFCVRQRRMCSNKDPFYESCIVYKGNNILNSFLRQKPQITSSEVITTVAQVEVPEEIIVETCVTAPVKVEVPQTIAPAQSEIRETSKNQ